MGDSAQTGPEAQAVALSTEQIAAQVVEAKSSGASVMLERIKTIQTCDEAKGRAALAAHLAFNTEMGADEAKALLEVASQEVVARSPINALAAGMAAIRNPTVGADPTLNDDGPNTPSVRSG